MNGDRGEEPGPSIPHTKIQEPQQPKGQQEYHHLYRLYLYIFFL